MTEKVTAALKIGDQVGYSQAYLQSTCQFTGDAPFARATIRDIEEDPGIPDIAVLEWDRPGLPKRVLVANLARIGTTSWAG